MCRLALVWKYCIEAFLFFFTLKKIKYRSNIAASSDFIETGRRMIIYTSNQTFQLQ